MSSASDGKKTRGRRAKVAGTRVIADGNFRPSECIRELESPAKLFGGNFHVRQDYPSLALIFTFVFSISILTRGSQLGVFLRRHVDDI